MMNTCFNFNFEVFFRVGYVYSMFACLVDYTTSRSNAIRLGCSKQVVNEVADVHCPVVEIPTRSKLSCLSWNKCVKPLIASSDYEGIVTVWDVNTRQSLMEYEEHEKRAWSVDFSRTEPSMLVSGSDDGKVKTAMIISGTRLS